jgi:hypothetical protein
LPLFLVATVLVAGTLVALTRLERGKTERGVFVLAATWAIVVLGFGGWIIPLAEPYRTSRVLGERLAALSAKMGLEPVLLEYQEPGVIYALGRPVALTRDKPGFFAHFRGGRSILTVALPSQSQVMREKLGLTVTQVEEVDGLVLNKGKREIFQIVIVGGKDDQSSDRSSRVVVRARHGGLQEPLVK